MAKTTFLEPSTTILSIWALSAIGVQALGQSQSQWARLLGFSQGQVHPREMPIVPLYAMRCKQLAVALPEQNMTF